MSELEVQGLVKRFGSETVVNRVSFRVGNNELFVLLGPEGSGKTSLLRMICGILPPDSGRILLNGQDITTLQPNQRNMGVVFQDLSLYPNMDVYGNIAYGLEARHVAAAEREMRIAAAASMLGLQQYLKQSILSLARDEQQRLALARAMVKDAEVYLYDEPLPDLSPRQRVQIRRAIEMMHRLKQKTSIYVTRDQNEAFSMAKRVGIMAGGILQQVGTPDELLHRPANIFVARFLGSPPMNIFHGYLQRLDTMRYRILSGTLYFLLPTSWTQKLFHYARPDVLIGIRPDAIVPEWAFHTLSEPPRSLIRALVLEVDPLVSETIVRLKVGPNAELTALFTSNDDLNLSPGQLLHVTINTQQICLFDPQTQQALNLDE